MNEYEIPQCAACPFKQADRLCVNADGRHPANCPTANAVDLSQESLEAMKADPELMRFAKEAALQECEGYVHKNGRLYPAKPRIVEIVEFAKRMGYKRLGFIFCMGLRFEAAITLKVLEANGFEVASVVCKVGGVPKEELGVPQDVQLNPKRPESMCNPVLQAELCNAMEVDFNVLLGLCVGHDSMALQHLKAPATVFAVKDRLMGNNPLGAIYTADTYCRYLYEPVEE